MDSSRDTDDAQENIKKLKFKYSITSIENKNSIAFKIEFDNPTEVSMANNYDRLKIKINRKEFKKAFIIMGVDNKMIELPQDKYISSIINIPL